MLSLNHCKASPAFSSNGTSGPLFDFLNPNFDQLGELGMDEQCASGQSTGSMKYEGNPMVQYLADAATTEQSFEMLAASTTLSESTRHAIGIPLDGLEACTSEHLRDELIGTTKAQRMEEPLVKVVSDSDGDDDGHNQQVRKKVKTTKAARKAKRVQPDGNGDGDGEVSMVDLAVLLATAQQDPLEEHELMLDLPHIYFRTSTASSSNSAAVPVAVDIGNAVIFDDGKNDGGKVSIKAQCSIHASCHCFVTLSTVQNKQGSSNYDNVMNSIRTWFRTARHVAPHVHMFHSKVIRESLGMKLRGSGKQD